MRKLIINGQTADIAPDAIIALTKAINSLWDFKDKRSNLSNTITLPLTEANRAIFQYADIDTITGDYRNMYDCNYIHDYVQIISSGKCKLNAVTPEGFEVVLLWGNIDLSDTLGSKTLQDLDLSDLNHAWTLANVAALYPVGVPPFEVLYPLYNPSAIGESHLAPGTIGDAINPGILVPFVELRRLIQQIAADNQLNFFGGIELAAPFSYVPVNDSKFRPEYNVEASFLQRDYTDTPDLLLLSVNSHDGILPMVYDDIKDDASALLSPSTGYYRPPETATYIVGLNLNVKFRYWDPSDISIDFDVYMVIELQTSPDGIIWTTKFTYTTNTYLIDTGTEHDFGATPLSTPISIPANYYLRSVVNVFCDPASPTLSISLYHTPATKFTVDASSMQFGNVWNIAGNMPDIKQIDLIKYACVLGGFIFEKLDNTNDYYFYRYSDILSDITSAQDLSDYFHSKLATSLHADLSQSNILKYSNDETVKPTTGEGVLIVSDDTLPKEQTIYEAPFAASAMESFTEPSGKVHQIARIPYFTSTAPAWVGINQRIVQCVLGIFESPYIYIGTTQVTSKFLAQFTRNDLSFSNIVTRSYHEYLQMCNNYRELTVRVNLDAGRFNSLDLSKPIYFRQLGGFYHCLLCKDFVKGKLTELIIVKI